MPPTLAQVLDALERRFGAADAPPFDPFAFVLEEQVAYLAPAERRAAAFAALAGRVGLAPHEILRASHAELVAVCALGGPYAPDRAERLRRSAALVIERCGGSLATALAALPLADARRLARAFDGFGAANAETLLLLAGLPVAALDSNGVRVLARVLDGAESDRYQADHRRACASLAGEMHDAAALTRAFLLLRRHGKTVCRRSRPACGECPLRTCCAYASAASTRGSFSKNTRMSSTS